ncbi:MAG: hypothetical protein R3F30_15110 [Planctomycetota bacterium]
MHELRSFRSRDYLEMGDRVLRLYAEAWPELPRRVLAALESRMQMWISSGQARAPREFGRRVVDFLDQQRHARQDFG